jgi:CSLREA domain-containing protein
VVNSVADPGDGVCNAAQCTLREAIADPQTTAITFASGLAGPITLARPGEGGGRLEIERSLTITGPSQRIAIRGRGPGLVFPSFTSPVAPASRSPT